MKFTSFKKNLAIHFKLLRACLPDQNRIDFVFGFSLIYWFLNYVRLGQSSKFFRVFALVFILSCLAGSIFSQTKTEAKNYEIVVLGLKIGTMKAEKAIINDSMFYKVDSQVKFWFFGSVDLKFNTTTHFLGNRLVKARSNSKTNRGDFSSKVDWKGTHYAVHAASYEYENVKPLKGPLGWSSTKMFFQEPSDKETFLSEVYGVAGPIKKIGTNSYEVVINGNTNKYFYKDGLLEKIVIENPIKNYQVRLVK